MIEWDPRLYKWEQIANTVAERIKDGTYPPLSLISEVKLQEEFDVARVTVRKAMEALREQGLITTKPGKGSIVSPSDEVDD
ncbi:winged helix-turn-helix transcriptional regulator [Microbispora sp. NEAU-D428]|uniref:GntR family transcriptional regulator n=1 Tax=Microbispora sitophila TaxID=2771537 RepID=UPI001868DB67|nr:winged helix-turn-helix domain-containing protein [Microbispora sitophila]MBE3010882.1 winged helix-turn-helix transcriptional regulator [Microbispora sitophila]